MYNKSGNMYNMYKQEQEQDGVSVTQREPCSETLFQLRNLYPRSTQNTDAISSINFPNPIISLLISCYLDYQDCLMYKLPRLLG